MMLEIALLSSPSFLRSLQLPKIKEGKARGGVTFVAKSEEAATAKKEKGRPKAEGQPVGGGGSDKSKKCGLSKKGFLLFFATENL